METEVARISRKALYDEVWVSPLTTLAKKYSMSNVGLAKICRKYEIPNPPRGYWAKLQHGKRIRRTPLPKPEYNPEIIIREVATVPRDPEVKREIEKAHVKDHIPIPEDLRGAHQLVKEVMRYFEAQKPSFAYHGIVSPSRRGLHIKVSKDSQRRALLLMDGLIKALEARNYRVSVIEKSGAVVSDINGHLVGFEISELLNRTARESSAYTSYDYSPSSRLCIRINEHIHLWKKIFRHQWKDGEVIRLESQLGSVIAGMIICAEMQAKQIAENEVREKEEKEEERLEQEKERVRQELASRINEEKARINALLVMSEAWHKSRRLRVFLAAYKEWAEKDGQSCAPESDLGKYLNWAYRQADRLDPLAKSPPSIIDRSDELEEP